MASAICRSALMRMIWAWMRSASVVAFAMVNGTFEEVFLLGVLARGLKDHGLLFAGGFSLLVRLLYRLRTRGTAAAPKVTINPLSILTPGMFREIFRRTPPKLPTE